MKEGLGDGGLFVELTCYAFWSDQKVWGFSFVVMPKALRELLSYRYSNAIYDN